MSIPPDVTIAIPIHNEEPILSAAVLDLRDRLEPCPWSREILLCENGSRDGTAEVARQLSARFPEVSTFSIGEPNYGRALRMGIERAAGSIVVCDEIDLCDLSFYDHVVPPLLRGEADLIIGSKAAKGASDKRPLIRRVATRVHNGLLRLTLGFKGTDTHGLKAFRRERLMPVIARCVVDMDVFASEFVVRAWRENLDVREIPIQLEEKRQPSIHLFKRVPNVLKNVARLVYVIRVRGE